VTVSSAVPCRDRWAGRIARAQLLAERHPPAVEVLHFFARLAAHQQGLAAKWAGAAWNPALVLDGLPGTLDWLAQNGPPGLIRALPALREAPNGAWQLALDRYLAEDVLDPDGAPMAFVIEARLQPLADARASGAPAPAVRHDNRCPFCQQRPGAGVLRDAGQGTRRALVCGLCFTEWPFERIVCPSCGERRFEALPVYTAEQVSGARVDGCDSCGVYLKTIDASRDNTVVPEVDDLATLTLDLWAREHGYRRLRDTFYL
jgi:FdhE protein